MYFWPLPHQQGSLRAGTLPETGRDGERKASAIFAIMLMAKFDDAEAISIQICPTYIYS